MISRAGDVPFEGASFPFSLAILFPFLSDLLFLLGLSGICPASAAKGQRFREEHPFHFRPFAGLDPGLQHPLRYYDFIPLKARSFSPLARKPAARLL